MKIFFTLFIVLSVIFSLSSVGTTISYYQNIDTSADNTLNSAILNLGVSASDFTPPEIEAGETSEKIATVTNLGGVDFQYSVVADNFSGDVGLCNTLDLVAALDGEDVFTGKLNAFSAPATTTHFAWQYKVSLPSDTDIGDAVCNFDLVFKAWQTNTATFDESGYRDSETIQNTIASHKPIEKASPLRLLVEPENISEVPEGEGSVEGEATSTDEALPEVDASPEEVLPPLAPPVEDVEQTEVVGTEVVESTETQTQE